MNFSDKLSFRQKIWHIWPSDNHQSAKVAAEAKIPLWQAELLRQRKLTEAVQISEFMRPSLDSLPSPFLFKNMEKGVKLIEQAINDHLPIVILGDYDVDGVTGTALLARFFTSMGLIFTCLHPDRFEDGYGLKARLVEKISERAGVVITVDCGISDVDEVEILKKAGWQVIITDHHLPPDDLPPADVIINPWLKDCNFPFKNLAGVGVAFYLVMGIRNYLSRKKFWPADSAPNLKELLDLVAIGTIADMVDLQGLNRTMTKAGLQVVAKQSNKGIRHLLAICGISDGQLNSNDIAYQIAPRLNAAGRMGSAARASDLLRADQDLQAGLLAEALDLENKYRKEITGAIIDEAMLMAKQIDQRGRCIILHGHEWHEGLLGIVASKIVGSFNKPTIIFAGRNRLKGSARSIPGVNMHALLDSCADLLISYGGHSTAAGMSIQKEMLPSFIKRMEELMADLPEIETKSAQPINLLISSEVEIGELIDFNDLLQPFGQGNPEPVYCTDGSSYLRNIQLIGKDRSHIRFSASINGAWLNGVGFGFGEEAHAELMTCSKKGCAIAFNLHYNHYRGQRNLQLNLVDFIVT